MIIKTKNGKEFRVSDPAKIENFMEVFRNNKYPPDYQFLGTKNTLKKEEILSLIPENHEIVKLEESVKDMYFTIRLDYSDQTQNVTITSKELPIALWGFLKEAKVVLGNSAFRGKDIISITPDKVLTMGWNKGYIPTPYEQQEINKKLGKSMEELYEKIKEHTYSAKTLKELVEVSTPLLTESKTKLLK